MVGILWAIAYALDARDAAKVQDARAAADPAADAATNWDPLEQKVEQDEWFSAPRLRVRRAQVADEQKSERNPAAAAKEQAALTRIDARLRELKAVR
jgi:hypothetical protein